MLQLSGVAFTVGRSQFVDHLPGWGEATSKIYVKVQPDAWPGTIHAQLDTGAPWSVFDREVAEAIGVLEPSGEIVELDTRFGRKRGHLERVAVTLLADEGESLNVEATIFVCPDWPPGKNFLGYNGLLERIRIALDPPAYLFYFGPVP